MVGGLQDIKEALGRVSKPDVTHIRHSLMVAGSRACEYGSDKYERANYARPTGDKSEDFRRVRTYTRAAVSHLVKMLDEMEHHQAQDPNLGDWEGMKDAVYAADMEAGVDFPASGLPHCYHAVASLNMMIEQAVSCGLLPVDAGTPWRDQEVAGEAAPAENWEREIINILFESDWSCVAASTRFTSWVADLPRCARGPSTMVDEEENEVIFDNVPDLFDEIERWPEHGQHGYVVRILDRKTSGGFKDWTNAKKFIKETQDAEG